MSTLFVEVIIINYVKHENWFSLRETEVWLSVDHLFTSCRILYSHVNLKTKKEKITMKYLCHLNFERRAHISLRGPCPILRR